MKLYKPLETDGKGDTDWLFWRKRPSRGLHRFDGISPCKASAYEGAKGRNVQRPKRKRRTSFATSFLRGFHGGMDLSTEWRPLQQQKFRRAVLLDATYLLFKHEQQLRVSLCFVYRVLQEV